MILHIHNYEYAKLWMYEIMSLHHFIMTIKGLRAIPDKPIIAAKSGLKLPPPVFLDSPP
jgi:hypothetical protein